MTDDVLSTIAEEVMEQAPEAVRLFLDTPLSEYTVTEGFMLLFLLMAFGVLIIWFFRGRF